jgi:hypothetical protein
MPGEGFMLHMINTLRDNRRLKRSIRRKFKKGETVDATHQDWEIQQLNISEEELQKVIDKIKKSIDKENKTQLIIGSILFGSFLIVILYYWEFLF